MELEDYPELRNRGFPIMQGDLRAGKDQQRVARYPDLNSLYPPVESLLNAHGEHTTMNIINPDEMNSARQSGNDELSDLGSTYTDELTIAKARLVANEMRRSGLVEKAEAVHVSHRNGFKEWYQVNVLLDSDNMPADLLDEWLSEHEIEFRAPQAFGNRLILQFRVPEVEVVDDGAFEARENPSLADLFG